MKVSVLIPYASDGGQRDRIFDWTLRRYKAAFPDFEVCVGESQGEAFNRSAAINAAARKATGDVFVIADADLCFRPELIDAAIEALNQCAYVIPYVRVAHISYDGTLDLLKMHPATDEFDLLPIEGHRQGSQGGLGVVRRGTFNRLGGFDERFTGWGCEDDAWVITIRTLEGRLDMMSVLRIDATIYHLWHPTSPHANTDSPLYQKNFKLYQRYWSARNDADAISELIREEGHHATVQDHQPMVR